MRPLVRLVLPLVLVAGAVLPAEAGAQAWTPREATPAGNVDRAFPQLLGDGRAVWTINAVQGDGVRRQNLVGRAPGGPAALQAPFGGGFGTSSGTLTLSAPAADGTYFGYRNSSPHGVVRLGRGTDPATVVVEPTQQILALDVAPTGEAISLQDDDSTSAVEVAFRPAGPDGRFDTPRRLPLGSADRAYAVGITLDPDGGVFAMYKTEQPESVLTTYAPPGGSFATPTPVDIANADQDGVTYTQSTNGHVLASWGAPPANDGTTNSTRVFAAVRRPGQATLETPKLLRSRTSDYVVGRSASGITDDGTAYAGLFDGQPLTGCSGNEDSGRTAYLAVRRGTSAEWAVDATGGGVWPDRAEYTGIATAGNRVGMMLSSTRDQGAFCQRSTNASLRFAVTLGTGANLGSPTVLLDNPSVAPFTYPNSLGLAVDAAGRALLLTSERTPDGTYAYASDTVLADPGPTPDPGTGSPATTTTTTATTPMTGRPTAPAPARLPAPGRVTFSKDFSVVKKGTVTFKVGCAKASQGGVDICKTRIAIRERRTPTASGAAAAAKAKRLLASARATLRAGKTKTIKVKLNKAGRQALKRRKKVPVTITVTVAKGTNAKTVTKKVTLRR